MWILPSRLTVQQKQELAKAEAILFELADKVTEERPIRVIKAGEVP